MDHYTAAVLRRIEDQLTRMETRLCRLAEELGHGDITQPRKPAIKEKACPPATNVKESSNG